MAPAVAMPRGGQRKKRQDRTTVGWGGVGAILARERSGRTRAVSLRKGVRRGGRSGMHETVLRARKCCIIVVETFVSIGAFEILYKGMWATTSRQNDLIFIDFHKNHKFICRLQLTGRQFLHPLLCMLFHTKRYDLKK